MVRFVHRALPDFYALKEFCLRDVLDPDSQEDAAALINETLLSLLQVSLLVALPKDDPRVLQLKQERLAHGRPPVLVTNPAIPHHGIQPVGFPESIALIPTKRTLAPPHRARAAGYRRRFLHSRNDVGPPLRRR
jgi:hypothetical protein